MWQKRDKLKKRMKKTILLVDDDADFLTYLSNALRRQEYKVIATTAGSEAFALAQKYRPNLIILDIRMPEVDGVKVHQQLSSNPQTEKIPIIFLSGILPVRAEGKKYFIPKPIGIKKLMKVIDTIFSVKN